MPNLFRLAWPIGRLVAGRYRRLRFYSDHPEAAPADLRFDFAHDMAICTIKAFRIRFIVKGIENLKGGQTVFVLNHQSDFDAPIVMMLFRHRVFVVAKKAIATFPIAKDIMSLTDSEYLDRDDIRSEIRTMRRIVDKLKEDRRRDFAIWPEGTRTPDVVDWTVGEFKPGSFKPAYYAKTAIVPVAIFGGNTILQFNKPDHKVYPIQVTFLPRLEYEAYRDFSTVRLSTLVHDEVAKEVARQRDLYPRLLEYWNQPAHAREFEKDVRSRLKRYEQQRKADRPKVQAELELWQKAHPVLKRKYRPVEFTKEDRHNAFKAKWERRAKIREIKRKARKRK